MDKIAAILRTPRDRQHPRRRVHRAATLLLAACLASLLAFALTSCGPGGGPYEIVDAAYVESVLANGNDGLPAVPIVDVRSMGEFDEGHIPGAVNLVYGEANSPCLSEDEPTSIVGKFEKRGFRCDDEIILYCRTGVRAGNAAEELAEAGYDNIKVYKGSWVDWTSDPAHPVER